MEKRKKEELKVIATALVFGIAVLGIWSAARMAPGAEVTLAIGLILLALGLISLFSWLYRNRRLSVQTNQ